MTIEKNISVFIETQFPEVYREYGEFFVLFVQKYYEWMEQSNNVMYHTRRIEEYRDVDNTVDGFVVDLKEQYLKNIQLDTAERTRQLIKHSLDLYRSKGSDQSVDLFFRAIYGKPASVYYPGDDIFKLSNGNWIQPKYLEVTPSDLNQTFINKQIQGITSKATAFVERFIRKKVNGKYVNLLYISAINGDFMTGELVTIQGQNLKNVPTVIGSMTDVEIIDGGSDFEVGDVINVLSNNGVRGQAIVSATANISSAISFNIDESGWGYTNQSDIFISDHILTVSNLTTTDTNYFQFFGAVGQQLANISIQNANATLNVQPGDILSTYFANNTLAGNGVVLSVSNMTGGNATLFVNEKYGNLNFIESLNANQTGNVSFSNTDLVLNGISTSNQSNTLVGSNTLYQSQLIVGDQIKLLYFDNTNLLVGIEQKIVTGTPSNTLLQLSGITSYSSNNVVLQLINSKKITGVGTTFSSLAFGDRIALYSNATNFYTYTVSSVVNNTILYTQEILDFANSSTKLANVSLGKSIYLGANLISANIGTYQNEYANAKFIGVKPSSNIYFSNTFATFSNGSIISQKNGTATVGQATIKNVITNIGTATLIVTGLTGMFGNTYTTYLNDVLLPGIVFNSVETSIGVSNTTNQFFSANNNEFKSGGTKGTISRISTGALAGFGISNNLTYPENVTIFKDRTGPYFNIPLNATMYGFPTNPSGNATSTLFSTLASDVEIFGGIGQLININPGKNYDAAPIVVIRSDLAYSHIYGKQTFGINLTSQFFSTGELITQNTGAQALVLTSNSSELTVQRITLEDTFTVGQTITGLHSGASANLVSISDFIPSNFLGNNAIITANVHSAIGSISAVTISDSGYGYLQGENVNLKKDGSEIVGLGHTVLKKQGTADGFYENHNGFMSDKNKIYDGYYYQDYSYVVRTALSFDKYAEMLKNIIHVAGTQAFFEIAFETFIDETTINVHTEITS